MPASAAKRLPQERLAADRLLDHYRRFARALPWRSPPGAASADPYRVWLSEVMLQQTTVAAVEPRFERFIKRWPTVTALASACDEDILGEWAGLGYYARARNLIACAREVAERGSFPTNEAELKELPGVGAYTAAAISAIAFGRDSMPVDTNVERVVARLNALVDKPGIRAAAQDMAPPGQVGDFAQALMDLGASICRPHRPACPACPLKTDCAAFALGRPEDFPLARAHARKPHRHGVAFWHRRGGDVLLVRRPAKGLLGGMTALPGPDWDAACPPRRSIASVRHSFTHFTLDLHVVEEPVVELDGAWWQPLGSVAEAGLPTLYRTAIAKVLAVQSAMRAADGRVTLESGHCPP